MDSRTKKAVLLVVLMTTVGCVAIASVPIMFKYGFKWGMMTVLCMGCLIYLKVKVRGLLEKLT